MRILRTIGNVLRGFWRGLDTLRRILHLIVLLAVFSVLLAGAVGQSVPIPRSGALIINPTGVLVEELEGNPLDRALAELNNTLPPETLLRDVTDSLDRAVDDQRITTVILELDGLQGGGLAKLQAIGTRLDRVRAAGKKVIATGSGYTRDQYYLAARADEIIMHDLGLVYLEGYEYYRTFFRSALENVLVDLNVFRVGEFKSFVEPFIRDDMSAEDREASEVWLGRLWAAWDKDVTTARNLPAGAIQAYADDLATRLEMVDGHAAQAARDAGLVDRTMSRTEVDEYLREVAGESLWDDSYSGVDFRSYARATALELRIREPGASNVGIIVAAGEIVDGEAPPGTIGGDSLAAGIRQARLDDSIQAVVLLIDSPGGSMFASDVIFDEIVALKAAGKPVVASMSSVAASGGYYIAMQADEILASDTTITGSIGVGALFPTFQRSLDKLGITVDGFGTTQLAGQLRLDRALGDDARRILTASVNDAYRIFVDKVATARDLSFEGAEAVARGRVWTGADARERGLVDRIGGLEDAIEAAASRAGLEPGKYGRRYLEPEQPLLQRLITSMGVAGIRLAHRLGVTLPGSASGGVLQRAARAVDRELGRLARLNDPRGLYYHCFCIPD